MIEDFDFGIKNKRTNDEKLLKMLLALFLANKSDTIELSEFTEHMLMIMRDEFNGVVTVTDANVLKIIFDSGECFSLKIEKGQFPHINLL